MICNVEKSTENATKTLQYNTLGHIYNCCLKVSVNLDMQSKNVPDLSQWLKLYDNFGGSLDLSGFFRQTISWLTLHLNSTP